MLSPTALRRWSWTHKWSSLVCTVFMLLLCITGLPLIFHHEIGHLLGTEVEAPAMPANTPRASLDKVLATAHALHPERVVQFASHAEDDNNVWFVTLTPTPAPTDDFKSVAVDARTAQVLAQPRFDEGFMHVMFRLHVDLFAGLPGKLFLGFMGLLLLVAIVTGVVLYAPFMRKLAFGEVRRDRSTRVKWLDLHNLLGIVTLVWAFVVGGTGMINTWADLLIKYWQYDQLSVLLKPYEGQPTVPAAERGPLQQALEVAQAQAPGTVVVHCVPGHGVLQPAPQHVFHARERAAHLQAAQAGAGGCTHGAGHRVAHAAVVPDGAAGVAAAALWRLRRHADEDPLGAARHRHHRGAGQRAVPVAAQGRADGEPIGPRGWPPHGRFCRRRIACIGCGAHHRGGRMKKHSPFWTLWGWPIVMGVLSTTGLLTALVSDTWGDWWSWVALGVPVAVMGWYSWPRTSAAADVSGTSSSAPR